MVYLCSIVIVDEIYSIVVRAEPFAVSGVDGDAGDVDARKKIVGEVGTVVARNFYLLKHFRVGSNVGGEIFKRSDIRRVSE